jgi:hypothetical protein
MTGAAGRWCLPAIGLAAVTLAATAAVGAPATRHVGPASQAHVVRVHPLHAARRIEGTAKGTTAPAARSDARLLRTRSRRLVPVLVQLAPSVASYDGSIRGFAATSPRVTGRPLDLAAPATRRYRARVDRRLTRFAARLHAIAPAGRVTRLLDLVYGGVAALVPGNRIARLARLPGVRAVQRDHLRRTQGLTPDQLIGAAGLSQGVGGPAFAGAGTLVAVVDSGLWPEHPSFADPGLPAPTPTRSGAPRPCNFGSGFTCNNKVVGGDVFLATYKAMLGLGGEPYPTSARDGDGHGTLVASVAAGDPIASAPVGGIDRGPVSGIAPGAGILAYKAVSKGFGFDSDLAAAVQQAIADGADVIAYAVSGGTGDLSTDPVELAFLDAYDAGVTVVAAAGNGGPAAGTVQHLAPWVLTVGATSSGQAVTATVTATGGGDTVAVTGASAGAGAAGEHRLVDAATAAGYDGGGECLTPAPAGTFAGAIVICRRGGASRRAVEANVAAGGGAAVVLVGGADLTADAGPLPSVNVAGADGARLQALVTAHPDATATLSPSAVSDRVPDVLASFSGRGPAGSSVKPDIVAPGVDVLGGTVENGTPTFTYGSGTSLSAAIAAGGAALLKAAHPDWTPGFVRSAMQTTAHLPVLLPDGTVAGVTARGSGRLDLGAANAAALLLDEQTPAFAAAAADPSHALDLNIPSVDAPLVPGRLVTTRVLRNVTGDPVSFRSKGATGAGFKISVLPRRFTVAPGAAVTVTISIDAARAAPGSYERTVRLLESSSSDDDDDPSLRHQSGRDVAIPVLFVRRQGDIAVTTACDPPAVSVTDGTTSNCTVTIASASQTDLPIRSTSTASRKLKIVSAQGADLSNGTVTLDTGLPGRQDDAPKVVPADPSDDPGFVDLGLAPFSVPAIPVGDDDLVQLAGVPPFVFAGRTWTALSVSANGMLVAGGGTDPADQSGPVTTFPNPLRPNGVLAPFWTDLDGTGSPGIRAAVLDFSPVHYLVVQWDVHVHGSDSPRTFEAWIGVDGTEDIHFTYDQSRLPSADGLAGPLSVGAENADGSGGDGLGLDVAPTRDLTVFSTPGAPGGAISYRFAVAGVRPGRGSVTTAVKAATVRGETTAVADISVTR